MGRLIAYFVSPIKYDFKYYIYFVSCLRYSSLDASLWLDSLPVPFPMGLFQYDFLISGNTRII